jgi:hypothetical protein
VLIPGVFWIRALRAGQEIVKISTAKMVAADGTEDPSAKKLFVSQRLKYLFCDIDALTAVDNIP